MSDMRKILLLKPNLSIQALLRSDQNQLEQWIRFADQVLNLISEANSEPTIIYNTVKSIKNIDEYRKIFSEAYKEPIKELIAGKPNVDHLIPQYYLEMLLGYAFNIYIIPKESPQSASNPLSFKPDFLQQIKANRNAYHALLGIVYGYVVHQQPNDSMDGLLLLITCCHCAVQSHSKGRAMNAGVDKGEVKQAFNLFRKAHLYCDYSGGDDANDAVWLSSVGEKIFNDRDFFPFSMPSEYTLISVYGSSKGQAIERFHQDDNHPFALLGDAEWWWYGPKVLAAGKQPCTQDVSSPYPNMCWLRLDLEKGTEMGSPLPKEVKSYLNLRDLISALQSGKISVKAIGRGEFDLGEAKLTESGYVRR
jgi:hypothetical protein